MNRLTFALFGVLMVMAGLAGLGVDYGFGAYFDIISSLLHQIAPLIVLLFVVGIIFVIFPTPAWIQRIFQMRSK